MKGQVMKIVMKTMMRIYAYNNHLRILKLCSTLCQRDSHESVRSDDLLKVTQQVCGRDRNRNCILKESVQDHICGLLFVQTLVTTDSYTVLCGKATGYEERDGHTQLSSAYWVKKHIFASSKLA